MLKSLKLKKEENIYRKADGQQYLTVHPTKNRFSGKVYVQANPFTFSRATDFMGMLKNVNRGIVLGEIAGGSPLQFTAWLMPSLILPNTKTEAIIPLVCIKTKNNFAVDSLGMKPDFFVKNSIEEVLRKEDAVMNFALRYINNNL